MLDQIDALPAAVGEVETLRVDVGYFSAANVTACMAAGIAPLIAMGRQPHPPSLSDSFAEVLPAAPNPMPVQVMAHLLNTGEYLSAHFH